MYGDGDAWNCRQIALHLSAKVGWPIHPITVRMWVDDAYRERHLAAKRERNRVARERAEAEAKAALRCEHCGASAAFVRPGRRGRGRPRKAGPGGWDASTRTRLLVRGLELRARGVPYPSIAEVFDLYEDAPVSPEKLRHWLVANGAERDPAKARRLKEQMEARRCEPHPTP